jgi:hypothetical protein
MSGKNFARSAVLLKDAARIAPVIYYIRDREGYSTIPLPEGIQKHPVQGVNRGRVVHWRDILDVRECGFIVVVIIQRQESLARRS